MSCLILLTVIGNSKYGKIYKGSTEYEQKYTVCRLYKQEWFEKDKKKRALDPSYECYYKHPQGGPDEKLSTGPRYSCPKQIQCKIRN